MLYVPTVQGELLPDETYRQMPPCWCKFKNCAGEDIPRSTKKYHTRKDEENAHRNESAVPSESRHDMDPEPAPLCPDSPVSTLLCLLHQLHHVRVSSYHPSLQSLSCPTAIPAIGEESTSPIHIGREAAEERGRVYMEGAVAAGPLADEIGELSEDELGNDIEDAATRTADLVSLPVTSNMHRADIPSVLSLSNPLPADPRFPDENTPDPFRESLPSQEPSTRITSLNTPTAKFLLYLLVAWLHTACQLAFPACRAVLVVMGQILAAAGIITERHALYISLASVLASLGVEPVFQILPVCPSCLEVYPGNYPRDLPCRRCASPLFSHAQRHDRRQRTASSVVRPLLQFPMKSIEAQLREILAVPGMEELVEGWRTKSRAPGTYQDNFDGRICRELQGPDGRLFFENPLPTQCNELRIGLTLGVDWSVPILLRLTLINFVIQVFIPTQQYCALALLVPNVFQHRQSTSLFTVCKRQWMCTYG